MSDFLGGYTPGIAFIGEMSKEELISELTDAWRKHLESREMTDLKREVIQLRLAHVRQAMIAEAGLKEGPGFLGFPTITEDND